MSLFNYGVFTLHSGQESNFRIDCDALSDDDIYALAEIIGRQFNFSSVEGVPTGGLRLAEILREHCKASFEGHPTLIVDDVLTTGESMEEQRGDRTNVIGVVIFSRAPVGAIPLWITPLFYSPLLP